MYPSKNTSSYTAPAKNASSSANDAQSGQDFLLIDSTFSLLLDTEDKLLLELRNFDWNYSVKS